MTPVITHLKRAVSSYEIQEKYNERTKKLRSFKVQQIQKDRVTISEAAKKLIEERELQAGYAATEAVKPEIKS
ncbi:MAG: hypothetical protein ACE5FU_05590 [Nitrospinota bacterium]